MQQRSKSRFICDWLSATVTLPPDHLFDDPDGYTSIRFANGRVKTRPYIQFSSIFTVIVFRSGISSSCFFRMTTCSISPGAKMRFF